MVRALNEIAENVDFDNPNEVLLYIARKLRVHSKLTYVISMSITLSILEYHSLNQNIEEIYS